MLLFLVGVRTIWVLVCFDVGFAVLDNWLLLRVIFSG